MLANLALKTEPARATFLNGSVPICTHRKSDQKMPVATSSKPTKQGTEPRANSRSAQISLCHKVASKLREMIIRGDFESGAPIREVDVSRTLKISRTPLREAFKILASEGLVHIRPNQGARVTSIDLREIKELFETVAGVERNAAELAAQRYTPMELRQLELLQDSMENKYRSGDLDAYFAINQRVHRLIVSMAHNSTLQSLHDWLFVRVRRARYFALGAHERWEDSIEEHRDILDALRRRQPLEAGALVERHVRETGRVIGEVILQSQTSKRDISDA